MTKPNKFLKKIKKMEAKSKQRKKTVRMRNFKEVTNKPVFDFIEDFKLFDLERILKEFIRDNYIFPYEDFIFNGYFGRGYQMDSAKLSNFDIDITHHRVLTNQEKQRIKKLTKRMKEKPMKEVMKIYILEGLHSTLRILISHPIFESKVFSYWVDLYKKHPKINLTIEDLFNLTDREYKQLIKKYLESLILKYRKEILTEIEKGIS